MLSSTMDTIASLQAAIDSLSSNIENTSPVIRPKFWAGFTLKWIKYQEGKKIKKKSFSELIEVLNKNNPPFYKGNEFSVGWQFRYDNSNRPNPDSPKRTYPGDSITPDNITQLIVKVVNGVLVGVREIPVWAELPYTGGGTTIKIKCDHHKIYRDFGRTYHNFLESSSKKLKLRNFEFYKRETQLIYFTRTQLLLMGAILENSVSNSAAGKAKVLFSGYDQYVGRTGMRSRMDKMTTFADKGIPDPTNWFSLKAEIIPAEDFQDKAGPMAEESEDSSPPTPRDCCDDKPKPIPSPCDKRVIFQQNNKTNEGGPEAPSVANGHPCPDPWYYTTAVLAEANATSRLKNISSAFCILNPDSAENTNFL